MAGPDGGGLPPTDEWDDCDQMLVYDLLDKLHAATKRKRRATL